MSRQPPLPARAEPRVRIGVSSCLLGFAVRWDGGHKRDAFLTDVLGSRVEWVPVCPEIEIGLGVPREPIDLVDRNGAIRLVGAKTGIDHTRAMRSYARRRAAALAKEKLAGYVLKKGSPSCGLAGVKVHRGRNVRSDGTGLFAEALVARFPDLPVEEEGRLADPRIQDRWLERVFAYHALRALFRRGWTLGDLESFHTAHAAKIRARSAPAGRRLDRLLERAKKRKPSRVELRRRYESAFLRALSTLSPRETRERGRETHRAGRDAPSGRRVRCSHSARSGMPSPGRRSRDRMPTIPFRGRGEPDT